MNKQVQERIKIANSFKSIYGYTEKTPGKREKWLKFNVGLYYWIAMIMLVLLFFISFSAILQNGVLNRTWQESGLLVLMTFSITISTPYAFIELILLKHIKQIQNQDLNFPDFLNQDLQKIITKLNSKKNRFNYITYLTLIVVLASFLQVFKMNPYWNYFIFPVPVLCLFILIRSNLQIRLIRKNLQKFKSITVST